MYEPSKPLMKIFPENGNLPAWPQPSYRQTGDSFKSEGLNIEPRKHKMTSRKKNPKK